MKFNKFDLYSAVLWKHFFFIVLIPISIGCNFGPERIEKNSVIKEGKDFGLQEIEEGTIHKESFRLWHTIDQFDLDNFRYFGGFYEDRLKFYYRNNPGMQIGEANVDLLMLYFLDERLVKIRYHLDKNIENHLMDSLGIGNLDSRYTRKNKTLATQKTLKKLKDFNLSKKLPDEYGIIWDRYVISSSYLVNAYAGRQFSFDTITSNYIYIDQLKSYRKRLIEIENQRVARLRGDTLGVNKMF